MSKTETAQTLFKDSESKKGTAMNKNALFLISFGCLFILLSYMMAQPLYLMLSGLVLIVWGVLLLRRDRKNKSHAGKEKR